MLLVVSTHMTIWSRLSNAYGGRYIAFLASICGGLKGTTATLLASTMLPLFRNVLHLSNSDYQACLTIIMLPWAMKSIFGLAVDRMRCITPSAMFVAAALVGTVSAALLATQTLALYATTALAFGISCHVAIADVLTEGSYARQMRRVPGGAADLLTVVWWFLSIGSLVGTILSGVLAEHNLTRAAFWIACALCAQSIMSGSFPRPVPLDNPTPGLFLLGVTVTVAACGLGLVSLSSVPALRLAYPLVSTGLLLALAFAKLPKELAMCNAYMCVSNVLYISLAGPLDFWYTADQTCVPGGPSFSMSYYITFAGAVAAVSTIIGVAAFNKWIAHWQFQDMFRFTAMLRCCAAVADIIIINRWNLAIGIPDEIMFVCGNAVVAPIIAAMDTIPMVALTAKLCPPNEESTVYALLASFQNFGGAAASALGLACAHHAGIMLKDTGHACSFDNLAPLVVVCNMLLPMLVYPLTYWLPAGGM